MEMIALMHKAVPYGNLLVYGKAPTATQLASLARTHADQIPGLLDELESAGVFSRTRIGVVYSRRLTRDEKRRKDGETAEQTGAKVPGSRRQQAAEKQSRKSPPTGAVGGGDDQPPHDPEAISQRETKVSLSRAALESEFERWYDAYPLKKGRGDALKAFAGARKKASLADLIDGANRYRTACVAKGTEPQWMKHPGPWLNAERWRDEPDSTGAPAVTEQAGAIDWPSRLRSFRVHGTWLQGWGPEPGQPGCVVPKHLLEGVAA